MRHRLRAAARFPDERDSMTSTSTTPSRAGDAVLDPRAATIRLFRLCLGLALGFLVICLPLPAIPLFVHDTLHYNDVLVGAAVGIQFLATILTRGLAGRLSDQHGPRRAMIAGLCLAVAAGLAYALAATMHGWAALAVLFAGRLVMGGGESLLTTGTLAWAIGSLGAAQAGRVMSWAGAAMYGALAVGAPIGLAIAHADGFGMMGLASACAPMLGLAAVLGLPPVAAVGGTRIGMHQVIRLIAAPGIALCLQGVGFAAIGAFISLYFQSRGWSGAGLALTAFGAAFGAMRLVCGRLPDRFGGPRVALVVLLIEALGQALLWLADAPQLALFGAAVTGLGCSLVFPALGTVAVGRVPPQNRGTALGSYAAFQDVSYGLTGPLTGWVAARHGYAAVFLIGCLAALAGAAMALSMARRHR